MAFTDYGTAKGLGVTVDYQSMINQEDKRFALENEAIQQKKADVEKQASEMKLGTVYDQYNQGRYNSFIKDVYKELADFDIQNEGYEYDPEKLAKRKNIISKIQDNDIIRESSQNKAEADKLYEFINKTPGAENMPAIKEQLAELSNALTKGNPNSEGGTGFRFKQPVTKSIIDEITILSGMIGEEKIQHKNGMYYTENVLNETKLESVASQYMLDPLNAELAKQAYANEGELMQELDKSPKAMMMRLMKASFNPKKSEPKQWNVNTASGSSPRVPANRNNAVFDYYGSDIKNGSHIHGNRMLKAWADGEITYDADGNGTYIVTNRDSMGNSVLAYQDGAGKFRGLQVAGNVEIVSASDIDSIPLANGKKSAMVRGYARWNIDYKNPEELQNVSNKYSTIPGVQLKNDANTGKITVTIPALFPSHNNPTRYNQYVSMMFPSDIPQGVIEQNGGVPSKYKQTQFPNGTTPQQNATEVPITPGAPPAGSTDLGNGIFYDANTDTYYQQQ